MAKNSGIEALIKKLGNLDVAELQEIQKAAKTKAITKQKKEKDAQNASLGRLVRKYQKELLENDQLPADFKSGLQEILNQ
jgi:predicted RNase H-like nuclease (RuvC/YqgF family)